MERRDNWRKREIGAEQDCALVIRAEESWQRLKDFRSERERCKRFTYGVQWEDKIEDKGVLISEGEQIMRQGNIPLKNNLIRRLVRNVLGVYRNKWKMPSVEMRDDREARQVSTLNELLRYNIEANRLEEMYARSMEEFLISGMVVHKKWYGRCGRKSDCRTEMVSPAMFFVESGQSDFRGETVALVGELHEMSFEELSRHFAHGESDRLTLWKMSGGATIKVYEVWYSSQAGCYRFHDLSCGRMWRGDSKEKERTDGENRRRMQQREPTLPIEAEWVSEQKWRYKFLTADGTVLAAGESPYRHGEHPYVFKAYPYVDGEIHSFVSDIIDQQKITNRLISMYDWILRASAKGVLLFPEGSLPDGVDINDVAEEWSRFNGVIIYRPKTGVPLPQQVSSRVADIGITELLEIQMKMMEDISGVNGALQGKLDSNSMSGTLYNQQTQNSLTALADMLKSFDDFTRQATLKDLWNMRQYYTGSRIRAIIGYRAGLSAELVESETFGDTDCDLRVTV